MRRLTPVNLHAAHPPDFCIPRRLPLLLGDVVSPRGGTPSGARSPSPAPPAAALASHALQHRCTALSSAASRHPDPRFHTLPTLTHSAWANSTYPYLLCRSPGVHVNVRDLAKRTRT